MPWLARNGKPVSQVVAVCCAKELATINTIGHCPGCIFPPIRRRGHRGVKIHARYAEILAARRRWKTMIVRQKLPCKPLLLVCLVVVTVLMATQLAGAQSPKEIVKAADLRGGLVVHVGCGDGKVTASLSPNENVVVQGLDRSDVNIKSARQHLHSKDLYGRVSIRQWSGNSLPYNDNLVNLLLVESPDGISQEAMLRVLVPGGTAYVKKGEGWEKLLKVTSPELDDWTHSLYDASGNAVSRDRAVAPSKFLQWFSGPRFGRQHEHMSSFSALVSDAGRIFYIVDEGSPASIMLPSDWKLIAKDAYNGGLLWKRPIAEWQSRYWPMKNGPVVLPRRLVAVGGEVFVTLGIDAPISVLDAADGKTLRRFDQTKGTFEFVVSDGVIFAVVNKDGRLMDYKREMEDMVAQRNTIFERSFPNDVRYVMAVDGATCKTLWKIESRTSQSSLSADAKHVAFHDNEGVVCLERATGRQRWKTLVEQAKRIQSPASRRVALLPPRRGPQRGHRKQSHGHTREALGNVHRRQTHQLHRRRREGLRRCHRRPHAPRPRRDDRQAGVAIHR